MKYWLIVIVVPMWLGGCSEAREAPHGHHDEGNHRDEHGVEHSDVAEVEADNAALDLTALRGVDFADVGEPVEEGVWAAAEAVPDESARRGLTAPVAGVVAAIEVAPGRAVDAGQPLLEIRSTELAELRSQLVTSRAELERARAELAREERLEVAGAGIKRELEAARAAVAVASAHAEAARLALTARGIDPGGSGATAVVRAPDRGRVAGWAVLEGEGVAGGAALGHFETGAAALVRVELALPGAPTWAPGTPARVRRADGREWQARVEGIPSSLDATTRRLGYRLRIEGGESSAGALPLAGTPLEVRVPLPIGIVVPQTALQQIEGTWGVFVASGSHATFRPVQRGPELGGDVLVLAGLSPGERVATSGAYLLKALSLKQSGAGDGHAH